MGDLGYVVLIIFIIFRILIAVGVFYLVVVEIRKYKRRSSEKDRGTVENVDRKDIDSSHGSGS